MLAVSVPSFRSISGREAVTTTSFSNSVSGCRRMVFCSRAGDDLRAISYVGRFQQTVFSRYRGQMEGAVFFGHASGKETGIGGKGENVDKGQGAPFFVIYFAFCGDGFVRFLPLHDEILFPFDAKEGFAGQYKVDGFAFRLFADADGHPITFCSVVGEEDVFSSCLFQLLQCFGQAFVL